MLKKERATATPQIKKDINAKVGYLRDYNNSYCGIYSSPEKKKADMERSKSAMLKNKM